MNRQHMLLPRSAEQAHHTLGSEHAVNDFQTIRDPLNRPNSSKWHVRIRIHVFTELHTYDITRYAGTFCKFAKAQNLMHFILNFTAYILLTWKTVQIVACIVLDTDKNINLPVQIVFPLGYISISTAPVGNAKHFIEEDKYLVKRNISNTVFYTALGTLLWNPCPSWSRYFVISPRR